MPPALHRFAGVCVVLAGGILGCRDGATVSDGAAPTDGSAAVDAVKTDAAPGGLVALLSSLNPRSVYLQSLDPAGTLTPKAVLPTPEAAQAFTSSADGRFLYVLGRTVGAFSVDAATGGLNALDEGATGLSNWAAVAVDPSRRWLILSDNTSGIAVFGLRPDGGIVQLPGTIVSGQVASDLTWDPTGKFLFALSCYTDVVARCTFDGDTGALEVQSPWPQAPDTGPGRLVFHPSGKTAYVLNIKAQTVTSFTYDAATGTLAQPETASTVASGATPLFGSCYPGHLVVHPSGRFAYATTTQGAGAIAIMSVAASGRLTVVDREEYFLFRGADGLAIDPTGTFLLVGNASGGLQVFKIDQSDGRLTYVTFGLQGVVALRFLP